MDDGKSPRQALEDMAPEERAELARRVARHTSRVPEADDHGARLAEAGRANLLRVGTVVRARRSLFAVEAIGRKMVLRAESLHRDDRFVLGQEIAVGGHVYAIRAIKRKKLILKYMHEEETENGVAGADGQGRAD